MIAHDLTHLNALQLRLSHERARLAANPSELRRVWIAGIEKEIEHELAFLGIAPAADLPHMTDDELLAALDL